jgi:hypothetical protein
VGAVPSSASLGIGCLLGSSVGVAVSIEPIDAQRARLQPHWPPSGKGRARMTSGMRSQIFYHEWSPKGGRVLFTDAAIELRCSRLDPNTWLSGIWDTKVIPYAAIQAGSSSSSELRSILMMRPCFIVACSTNASSGRRHSCCSTSRSRLERPGPRSKQCVVANALCRL